MIRSFTKYLFQIYFYALILIDKHIFCSFLVFIVHNEFVVSIYFFFYFLLIKNIKLQNCFFFSFSFVIMMIDWYINIYIYTNTRWCLFVCVCMYLNKYNHLQFWERVHKLMMEEETDLKWLLRSIR